MVNTKNLAKNNKHEIILLIFFILGLILRINLDGIPLDYPGNLKAADPFYHVAETDLIINNQGWKYYPDYLSYGVENAINPQPPLLYTNSAILSIFSGLPSWSSIYFISALFSALRILILYFLVFEIFKNKNISLLAASLLVLPLPVYVWLYELYIGFWLQVFALTYLVASAWIIIKYSKTKDKNYLVLFSFFISSILLSHAQDLIFLIIPCLAIGLSILKEKVAFKTKTKKLLSLGIIPLILILVLSPWLLNIWGGGNYDFKWNENPFPGSQSESLPQPSIKFVPAWIGVIAFLGLFVNLNNLKKYKELFILGTYYLLFVLVLPYFFKDPYYLGRAKTLMIFVIAPFFSLGIYYLILLLSKFKLVKLNSLFLITTMGILLIWSGIGQYNSLKSNLVYEHIDNSKWQAITWIQDNVQAKEEILFLEDCGQASCLLTRQRTFNLEDTEFISKMQEFIDTGTFPESFNFQFSAQTIVEKSKNEEGYLNFKELYLDKLRENYKSINDFEYIYLRNINNDFMLLNEKIIESLEAKGYVVVYKENDIIILNKNDK